MRLLPILILAFIPAISIAQIKLYNPNKDIIIEALEAKVTDKPYDSLTNSPGKNLKGFIGQKVYCNEKGQKNFYYSPISEKKWLKASDSTYQKYFTVTGYEFICHNPAEQTRNLYLLLKSQGGEKIYFRYCILFGDSDSWTYSFPFVTEGHYKKIAEEYIGKELLWENEFLKTKEVYKCLDVYLKENTTKLTLKVKGKSGITEIEMGASGENIQLIN